MSSRFLPHVTVACVVHCQGRYLLVEELIAGTSTLNQPAGHLEAEENLTAACQRELEEETGLQLAPKELVAVYQFVAADGTPFVRFTFGCELDQPLPAQPQDPQIQRCHWLSREEITAWPLRSPLVLQSIDDYQAGRRLPIDAILDKRLHRG
ncbi:NUDIX hydrolase [Ferrimonas marina]|uniref:Phosphatase NudJ n=1 Tax=Ferrimonas marina TaxID=299255 RepID=A0A1M5N2V8_9GAMM|nr:NUDIX hydrolase [Ferrimonas marina]SHG83765.1 phosphatase NudJ [Ferrimonas marina]